MAASEQVLLLSTTLERSEIACILKSWTTSNLISDRSCSISHAFVMFLACLASDEDLAVVPSTEETTSKMLCWWRMEKTRQKRKRREESKGGIFDLAKRTDVVFSF